MNNQPIWKRFVTILAGPAMNFLLGIVLTVVLFLCFGITDHTVPVVDRARCVTCLKCAEACPSGALYDPKKPMTVEEVFTAAAKDKKYYDKSGGGVTVSGGEPMSQFPFTLALANLIFALL